MKSPIPKCTTHRYPSVNAMIKGELPARRAKKLLANMAAQKKRNVLPTLKAFRRLSVLNRAKIFSRWLKTKAREKQYQYMDVDNCPLAQFGRAICRNRTVQGAANEFRPTYRSKYVKVFDLDFYIGSYYTFGSLSDAFAKTIQS